jgi:hypothetical protein
MAITMTSKPWGEYAMWPKRLRNALGPAIAIAAIWLLFGLTTSNLGLAFAADGAGGESTVEESAVGLSAAQFDQLRTVLDLKNQPWATIPWKYSITEARRLAAASRKPIFMVVNTGNALGCT